MRSFKTYGLITLGLFLVGYAFMFYVVFDRKDRFYHMEWRAEEVQRIFCHLGSAKSCSDFASARSDMTYYRIGCRRGAMAACTNLGRETQRLVNLGVMDPSDMTDAFDAFSTACDAEFGTACVSIAHMLRLGQGTPVDLSKARSIFAQYCPYTRSGQLTQDEFACLNLLEMAEAGEGGDVDPDEALAASHRYMRSRDCRDCYMDGAHRVFADQSMRLGRTDAERRQGYDLIDNKCQTSITTEFVEDFPACIVMADILVQEPDLFANLLPATTAARYRAYACPNVDIEFWPTCADAGQ